MFQHAANHFGNLNGEERGHGIPHLGVLGRPVAEEYVRIWKGLQARRLPHGETSTLCLVMMDERMSVLRDVACDGHAEGVTKLHSEAILEDGVVGPEWVDVPVFRK